MHRKFARLFLALFVIVLTGCASSRNRPMMTAQPIRSLARSEPLINGKNLSPDLPSGQSLGNLPVNVIVSPDGKNATWGISNRSGRSERKMATV
jgi:hypothetical protein